MTQWIDGAEDLIEQINQANERIHSLLKAETTESNLPEHEQEIEV